MTLITSQPNALSKNVKFRKDAQSACNNIFFHFLKKKTEPPSFDTWSKYI